MQQSQRDRGGMPAHTALGRCVESAPMQNVITHLFRNNPP